MLKYFDDAKEFKNTWSKKNTLVVHLLTEPESLHPSNGISYVRTEVLQYIQKCLLSVDFKTMTIVPGLAESLPDVSTDSLKYIYRLRKDVKWDDGSPLTVSDVIFSIKAYKCPLTNNSSVKSYWSNFKDVTDNKDGSLTIEMFRKNFQNITFISSVPIIQQKFFDPENALALFSFSQFNDTGFHAEKNNSLVTWSKNFNDDANGRDPQRINGLGMYKVSDWQTGQFIILEKKQNHWTQNSKDYHDTAFPDKIIFTINKDEASQVLDFRNQKFDVSLNCTVNVLAELSADNNFNENYNSTLMPTYNYTYVCFNEKPDSGRSGFFTDVNVRKAMTILTPVNELTKIAYREFASQCKRMISNVSPIKDEFNQDLKPVTFDEKKAKELLSQSGWKDSDGDGILDKTIDGKKIIFSAELNYLTSSPEWKGMATYLAEQYLKAGLKITPVPMDLKTFVEKGKDHDFDLMLGSWGGSGLPEDYTQLWHTSSWSTHGSNYSGFGNAESDELIESMKQELNDSARKIMSHKLQRMIYDDQPMVFLYTSMRRNIIHKRFGNQMLFSERPGIMLNNLKLLSGENVVMQTETQP